VPVLHVGILTTTVLPGSPYRLSLAFCRAGLVYPEFAEGPGPSWVSHVSTPSFQTRPDSKRNSTLVEPPESVTPETQALSPIRVNSEDLAAGLEGLALSKRNGGLLLVRKGRDTRFERGRSYTAVSLRDVIADLAAMSQREGFPLR